MVGATGANVAMLFPPVTNTDAAAAPDPTCRLSGGEAVTASGVDVARLERCGDLRRGLSVGETETDYLVVGAGVGDGVRGRARGRGDADVVVVDRRHSPGGHWLDAYPFVRLHQPSANYGVNSRVLGHDRIDETGPNAGFYGDRRGDLRLLPAGPRRDPRADRQGALPRDDRVPRRRHRGHRLRSLLTGEETTVRVRRRLVDATYIESSIPSRHVPPFTVDAGVRLIPPNDLVDLDDPAGFTVLGGQDSHGHVLLVARRRCGPRGDRVVPSS